MKKVTLSVALLASVLALNAQDTICTMVRPHEVVEFNYQTNEIMYEVKQKTRYYDIEIKYGNVLCLDLSDKKNKIRKVITTFFDGTTVVEILDSDDKVYYSPQGTTKISVGKSRNIILSK